MASWRCSKISYNRASSVQTQPLHPLSQEDGRVVHSQFETRVDSLNRHAAQCSICGSRGGMILERQQNLSIPKHLHHADPVPDLTPVSPRPLAGVERATHPLTCPTFLAIDLCFFVSFLISRMSCFFAFGIPYIIIFVTQPHHFPLPYCHRCTYLFIR